MKSTLPLTQLAMQQLNLLETDGFEFVEWASLDPAGLAKQLEKLGFSAIAQHRSKQVTLYRQGSINFILNQEPEGFAARFAELHHSGVCAIALRVKNAQAAFEKVVAAGATPYLEAKTRKNEMNLLAIYGVGNTLIYFVDRYQEQTIYEVDFIPFKNVLPHPEGKGLVSIDHLSQWVMPGELEKWANEFYQKIFNFFELSFIEEENPQAHGIRRLLCSPCGKIKISLYQSLVEPPPEKVTLPGVRHIALSTHDIYTTVEALNENHVPFLKVPDAYYEIINERIKGHHEEISRMRKNQILLDGSVEENQVSLLLQIFTDNMIGALFFELVQRKGNEGFGEGNVKALAAAMEQTEALTHVE